MVEIGKKLSEGKNKRVYETNDPEIAVVYYKDEAMAFHGLKRGRIFGKGEVNNAVCAHLYQMLKDKHGIDNHFIRQIDPRQSLVKRCEIIPITIKVRNRVAGSLAKRIGWPVGTELNPTIIEINLKDELLDNPMINGTHVVAMKLATDEELHQMIQTAMKINSILADYMKDLNIELVDINLEFGRYEGKILLADEISPDTARFWDSKTHEPLDIDRFRRDLGDVEQAYQDLMHRIMGDVPNE